MIDALHWVGRLCGTRHWYEQSGYTNKRHRPPRNDTPANQQPAMAPLGMRSNLCITPRASLMYPYPLKNKWPLSYNTREAPVPQQRNLHCHRIHRKINKYGHLSWLFFLVWVLYLLYCDYLHYPLTEVNVYYPWLKSFRPKFCSRILKRRIIKPHFLEVCLYRYMSVWCMVKWFKKKNLSRLWEARIVSGSLTTFGVNATWWVVQTLL